MKILGRTKKFKAIPNNNLRFCFTAVLVGGLIFLSGCGGDDPLSLQRLTQSLRQTSGTYSVILENMKEERNFFKDHYRRYRILTPDKQDVTKEKPNIGAALIFWSGNDCW